MKRSLLFWKKRIRTDIFSKLPPLIDENKYNTLRKPHTLTFHAAWDKPWYQHLGWAVTSCKIFYKTIKILRTFALQAEEKSYPSGSVQQAVRAAVTPGFTWRLLPLDLLPWEKRERREERRGGRGKGCTGTRGTVWGHVPMCPQQAQAWGCLLALCTSACHCSDISF